MITVFIVWFILSILIFWTTKIAQEVPGRGDDSNFVLFIDAMIVETMLSIVCILIAIVLGVLSLL